MTVTSSQRAKEKKHKQKERKKNKGKKGRNEGWKEESLNVRETRGKIRIEGTYKFRTQTAIPNNLGKITITNALINEALRERYGRALME